jgi:hypothetical protein
MKQKDLINNADIIMELATYLTCLFVGIKIQYVLIKKWNN